MGRLMSRYRYKSILEKRSEKIQIFFEVGSQAKFASEVFCVATMVYTLKI